MAALVRRAPYRETSIALACMIAMLCLDSAALEAFLRDCDLCKKAGRHWRDL